VRGRPLGDGRIVLVLTEPEATALWVLLYATYSNAGANPALGRILRALGASRTSEEATT